MKLRLRAIRSPQLKSELDAAKAERARWERRVALLKADRIDPDMLDALKERPHGSASPDREHTTWPAARLVAPSGPIRSTNSVPSAVDLPNKELCKKVLVWLREDCITRGLPMLVHASGIEELIFRGRDCGPPAATRFPVQRGRTNTKGNLRLFAAQPHFNRRNEKYRRQHRAMEKGGAQYRPRSRAKQFRGLNASTGAVLDGR